MRLFPPPESPSPSRHRRQRPARPRGLVLSATAGVGLAGVIVAVLVATGSGGAQGKASADKACPGDRNLRVSAAPEIAPAVTAAARVGAQVAGERCQRIVVTAASPSTVLAELSGTRPVRPDVWIPDSSIWLPRAGARLDRATRAPSIAWSPVVVAVSTPVARQHGWPAEPLRLAGLTGAVRLGLAKPAESAASVGAVLGLRDALAPRGPAALASAFRRALTGLPTDPTRSLATLVGATHTAVATSEQAVWSTNAAGGSTRVVAGYLPADGMSLDYPFVVLSPASSTRALAGSLLQSLQGGAGRDQLVSSGFRVPSGRGPALRPELGVDPTARPAVAVPSATKVSQAVRTLRLMDLDSRMLAVIDVSGSMGAAVPGAGGASRLDLVTAAATRGLGLYPDEADIGLWVFATDLTPTSDYREVVPIGPLGTRPDGVTGRERLVQGLGSVRRTSGNTGLYDTTLAAVRAVRQGWDPERANSVVLLTDGRNDDSSGIGLSELLRTLRRENSGGHPVPVITIAYGASSDVTALRAISAATGGQLYLAPDARRINQVFLDAIGRRGCSSATC